MVLKQLFKSRVYALTPEEYLAKMLRKGLNPDGSPILDPVPLAPPLGYKKAPSMVEIVRDMVRGERLRLAAMEGGHETFEESEDFDVGDEPDDLRSGFENDFDPTVEEMAAAVEEDRISREEKAVEPVSPVAPERDLAPEK